MQFLGDTLFTLHISCTDIMLDSHKPQINHLAHIILTYFSHAHELCPF